MVLTFLGSFLLDALKLIKYEMGFFAKNGEERRTLIESTLGKEYPSLFSDYLVGVSESDFLSQVKVASTYLSGDKVGGDRVILDIVAKYIVRDFALKFDGFDRDFFYSNDSVRGELLNTVFPGDSFFQKSVRDYVFGSTYQEVTEDAQLAVNGIKVGSSIVVVQSAMEIGKDMRIAIRKFLAEKYPYSFVEFQINSQIIGGLRVFIDGQVVDHSWLSRIRRISDIAYT